MVIWKSKRREKAIHATKKKKKKKNAAERSEACRSYWV